MVGHCIVYRVDSPSQTVNIRVFGCVMQVHVIAERCRLASCYPGNDFPWRASFEIRFDDVCVRCSIIVFAMNTYRPDMEARSVGPETLFLVFAGVDDCVASACISPHSFVDAKSVSSSERPKHSYRTGTHQPTRNFPIKRKTASR